MTKCIVCKDLLTMIFPFTLCINDAAALEAYWVKRSLRMSVVRTPVGSSQRPRVGLVVL